MRVIKNGQVFNIGWRYENPNLKRILNAFDITEEQALELSEKKIPDSKRPGEERRAGTPALVNMFEDIARTELDLDRQKLLINILERIRMKGFPKPTVTKCILTNEEKEVLNYAIVKKFPEDVHDREKARRASLNKLLREEFPNFGDEETRLQNKLVRRSFWEKYLSRQEKKQLKPTNGVAHAPEEFVKVKEFAIH